MSKKKSKEEVFIKQSYFRLLKYTAPYKFRLGVGILAGFIVGGSLFGTFMLVPKLMQGVHGQLNDQEVEIAKTVNEILNVSKADYPLSEKEKFEKIKTMVYPDLGKDKVAKEIKNIKEKASKLGINLPVTYENGTVIFRSSWLDFDFPAEDKMGNMTWQFFSIFVLCFVLLWTLKNAATYINRYFTRWVGTRVVADLREKVFKKLMDQSLKFYGQADIGQLISRCTNDTASIESAVANTIADATRCPIEIFACVTAIIIASIQNDNFILPLILFVGLPICILPIVLVGRKIRKIYKKSYGKIAEVVSRMHEVFTGVMVVKAFHAEKREITTFKKVNKNYFKTVVRALRTELLMAPLMETVAVTSTLIFLVYSFSQKISITALAQLMIPAFLAYQPIKRLAKVSTYLQRSMAAADRYFNLIDQNVNILEKENPVIVHEFNDKIKFDNVVFSYNETNRILDGISFDIPKGSVIAVVGQTGSGKTTIANLIARFYDADSGSITIDGIEVRDIEITSLRDLIGIVTQDAILFNTTIADNIAYGKPDVSRDKIIEAARQANAHQFIIDGRHREGYDTIVGEKGFKLSGGEKQRIAIARAILKNPPILILDEATSSLDTVTERLVQEALDRIMENRTVFAIAHRLSTIKHADNIIVLSKGNIVEHGTHDQLLATDGQYRKLHNTQFGIHD